MLSWVKKAAAGLAALAILAGSAQAQVPDPYARELAQRLTRAEALLTENGYARAAGPFAGGMPERRARRYTVMLRAGQDYRIVGVCESRCGNLDLRLFAANDQLVAQDVLRDAVPVIHVRPVATGNYDIEAIMAQCNEAPCWFAFNVYSR
jgi:hypothetical protein